MFLTGGTGFLGSAVARLLVERGDSVKALVRDPSRAGRLRELGCEVVEGDLSDEGALVAALRGCTALVHGAGLYAVGVPDSRRDDLVDTNVRGTERMLGAALTAGIHKAVHVSSVVVFGDTAGRVVDETWTRDPALPWSSVYEETKAVAHGRAQDLSARGLPLSIVQPGLVYGPGDPSDVGQLLQHLLDGRLNALPFPELGVVPVHRDDAAEGVVAVLDKGVPGESYVLAGDPVRLRDLVAALAELSGRRPPRFTVPSALLKALSPLGAIAGPALGLPPNLAELVRCSHGVTFWASSDKAARELGWHPRSLSDGLRSLLAPATSGASVS
ncbi:MAG: NAD-dependent epimerase/dehydratase [Frankiales bacterium]|nr:NAD-dependent epimerase/dehydratase [Frankiales bacterium]